MHRWGNTWSRLHVDAPSKPGRISNQLSQLPDPQTSHCRSPCLPPAAPALALEGGATEPPALHTECIARRHARAAAACVATLSGQAQLAALDGAALQVGLVATLLEQLQAGLCSNRQSKGRHAAG